MIESTSEATVIDMDVLTARGWEADGDTEVKVSRKQHIAQLYIRGWEAHDVSPFAEYAALVEERMAAHRGRAKARRRRRSTLLGQILGWLAAVVLTFSLSKLLLSDIETARQAWPWMASVIVAISVSIYFFNQRRSSMAREDDARRRAVR